MARKIAKRRVVIAWEVGRDALCDLTDREIVALLLDVSQGLLLHLVVLIMLLIRLAQFDAERVLGRGFDLCKKGTRGRPTRVLLTLQGAELSTLSLQQLIQFAHRDVLTKHIRFALLPSTHETSWQFLLDLYQTIFLFLIKYLGS